MFAAVLNYIVYIDQHVAEKVLQNHFLYKISKIWPVNVFYHD